MITVYDNWLRFEDNGIWMKPAVISFSKFKFLCGTAPMRAKFLFDGDTLCFSIGLVPYKLKLSHHDKHEQNLIIDLILPDLEA